MRAAHTFRGYTLRAIDPSAYVYDFTVAVETPEGEYRYFGTRRGAFDWVRACMGGAR